MAEHSRRRGETFQYVDYDIDIRQNRLLCRYKLDGREFCETVTFPGGGAWNEPAVAEAARLVFLLAGISYYKTTAPWQIDVGKNAMTDTERGFLRQFYVDGLGEFAYRNSLDLSNLEIVGPRLERKEAVCFRSEAERPLLPFGGGVDSIVTVELVRLRAANPALFVVNRPDDRFDAIEQPARVTGMPIRRAERRLDEQVLRSGQLGFFNGHVPVTGILSVIAVMAAALNGCDAVIMSNERSASVGTIKYGGRVINHQYSKSHAFESGFRVVLAEAFAGSPDYFSLLRPVTGLWIAKRFAEFPQYLGGFHSCNRAFHIDHSKRLDHWCGHCDKCCFVDLILAPYLDEVALARVFDGNEPLADVARLPQFRTLLDLSAGAKPWECVGDTTECRAATRLAAARPDRKRSPVLQVLVAELKARGVEEPDPAALLKSIGSHFVPDRYAPADFVV